MTQTTVPALQISAIYVSTKGDSTVGDRGESVTIKADGDFIIDLDHIDESARKPVLERLRTQLEEVFSEVWSEKATARFDFELVEI